MKRNQRKPLQSNHLVMLGALTAIIISVFLLPLVSSAGDLVPFKAKMVGMLIPPSETTPYFTATTVGNGTLVGTFTQVLEFAELDFLTGAGHGTYIQTAANGDQLWGQFTAQFLNASDFLGTWTVEGGTGGFEDAEGAGTSGGQLAPDLTFTYAYTGVITSIGSIKR